MCINWTNTEDALICFAENILFYFVCGKIHLFVYGARIIMGNNILQGKNWQKNTVIVVLLLIILTALLYPGGIKRYPGENRPYEPDQDELAPYSFVERSEFLMGTIVTQRIYMNSNDVENGNGQEHTNNADAEDVADKVFERIREIEYKMAMNYDGSEVSMLNQNAGKGAVSLSWDTIYVLSKAKEYFQLSGGAFNPCVGPLTKAWGISFGEGKPKIPDENDIKDMLFLINCDDLSIVEKNLSAKLAKTGQSIDLGGIAKGYAADEAIKIYKQYGIESACINLGGSIAALGSKPGGAPWRIGIQHPRGEPGKYIGIVELVDKAIVTSGDYERYFMADDKRYHHILDPRTGYPASSGLISTTIITDLSIEGDALSTAVFVLGLKKGMELVESLEGVEGIFITDDKKIYASSGLRDNFIMNEKSKDFKYEQKK
jgi:thiamine biosynthesis lipoprotein